MVFELWIVKISCFEGVLCEIGKMGYEIRYIDRFGPWQGPSASFYFLNVFFFFFFLPGTIYRNTKV